MELETYSDQSKTYSCPACRDDSGLTYIAIPEHRREWRCPNTGYLNVTHMPTIRDYHCKNCDFEWSMDEPSGD